MLRMVKNAAHGEKCAPYRGLRATRIIAGGSVFGLRPTPRQESRAAAEPPVQIITSWNPVGDGGDSPQRLAQSSDIINDLPN